MSMKRLKESVLHMRPNWKHRDKKSALRLRHSLEPQQWQQLLSSANLRNQLLR